MPEKAAHPIISPVLTLNWAVLGATVAQSMGFHVIYRKGLLLLLALASLSHLSLTTAYRAQASPVSGGGRSRRARTAHIRTGPHPGARYNILQKVTAADVVMDPYPYIVIQNPLPDDVYDELEAEYPSDDEIAKHGYAKGHATVHPSELTHTSPHATERSKLCQVHASPNSSRSGIHLRHLRCSNSRAAAHAPPPPPGPDAPKSASRPVCHRRLAGR
jgi:hypothetical protein